MQKLFLFVLLALAACKQNPRNTADTIYYNGDIITMEGEQAAYAEAVTIKDGKISFVGTMTEANQQKGDSTVLIDLQGKTLVPGFIDGHGHVWNSGFQSMVANLLPTPDGTGRDIPSLLEIANEWKDNNPVLIEKYGWIIGFGYDDGQLKEHRHPTAEELDKISTTIPIIFIHQSGHLGVMNHKALESSGYTATTIDPVGGAIRREGGNPNGVLEEMALFIPLLKLLGTFDKETNEKIGMAGIESYTRFGFTTAQEGRASRQITDTWKALSEKHMLKIDVASYPDIQQEMAYMKVNGVQKFYTNHFRIAGVKLSLDGSPQGKTAWLTKPFVVPPTGKSKDYVGYPAIPDEAKVMALIDSAYKNHWQLLAHCSGDAASDEYIKGVAQAGRLYGNTDRRSVMIHCHTVREDQLDSMKALGILPSFFSMHTYYWGDWHRDQVLGKDRAYRISPAASALRRNMTFTQHHDAPVALPNSLMILYTQVNRVSRSGDIIGPEQRVDAYAALRSITSWAAFQYFEEGSKGSIHAGKLADFVVLDKNPLKVDPTAIKDIQVMETIKEGVSVYKK